ncbi:unnamed protein product [Bursaphelenchus xylophilus]|uniref:(pine wood nematode) hypothetical protein n=1 Tax=Bursaphelenchus xylophilus TaxID=6326 RepID=A0A1I7RWV1_BURXY|nr:unnamed protein product [Bursaphelenchus xylophilus]CAG9128725.1 unnamed protein product [Bursaphelenchus xylophilus]
MWVRPGEIYMVDCTPTVGENLQPYYWAIMEITADKKEIARNCEDFVEVSEEQAFPCPEDKNASCCLTNKLILVARKQTLRLLCYDKNDLASMQVIVYSSKNKMCPTVSDCSKVPYAPEGCECRLTDECMEFFSAKRYNTKYLFYAVVLVILQVLLYVFFCVRRQFCIPRAANTMVVNGSYVYDPPGIQKQAFVDVLNRTAYQD